MFQRIHYISIAAALLLPLSTFAQINDDSLVKRAVEMSETGMDSKQIAAALIAEGATPDQLTRLYREYGNILNSPSADIKDAGEKSGRNSRTRMSNQDFSFVPAADYSVENKIYGHDIFRENALTFQPQMNVATPEDYQLGAGDELIVDVFGASQLTHRLEISPDGKIVIPNIGPLSVSGLSVKSASKRISNFLSSYYADCSFSVSLGNVRSVVVNVLGEVRTPGTYTLSALSSVFNALYLSGGITDIGSVRSISVNRGGSIVSTIDIYEYLATGDMSGNIMLKDNDVILVRPYINIVNVTGKVRRPMMYELKEGETVSDAINFAGGFTGDAFVENVRVYRSDETGPSVHTVENGSLDKFVLKDIDHLDVGSVLQRYVKTVEVTGAVHYPGKYTLSENINTVKELVAAAGGLDEQVFINRAVLKRMNADRTLSAMTINLKGIVSGVQPDVNLQNEDILVIASRKELLDARTLTIEGEVFVPGKYPYSDGETIEDLIVEAGGLRETASVVNVEVARRILREGEKSDPSELSKLFTFTLNENLEIAQDSEFVLEPYDYVIIHRNPEYEEQKAVTITGDVMFAGRYVLTNRGMTLSDLIARAGGLKPKAYAKGARLSRVASDETSLILNTSDQAVIDSSLVQDVAGNLRLNVEIDLMKALSHPGSADDIVLVEGDEITIPQLRNTVDISGAVFCPNSVTYRDDKPVSYYIDMAGGYDKNALRGSVYILHTNGKISKARRKEIEPGCKIVVPEKPHKEGNVMQNVQIATSIASILATTAAVIVNAMR